MNTKDKLSQALLHAGLPEMAQLAREGYYHDFESPLSDPAMELDRDLAKAAQGGNLAALARKAAPQRRVRRRAGRVRSLGQEPRGSDHLQ